MASFSRSSSEDSEQERESEDSDRILMRGGPVEPYQDEPLAVDNSDSDESDSEEDEDGLSPRGCSCFMVNVLRVHAFFSYNITCGYLCWHRKLLKIQSYDYVTLFASSIL